MNESLCDLWQNLLNAPQSPEALANARARGEELIDHIEDCAVCIEAGKQTPDQMTVVLVLSSLAADDPLSAEDDD